MVLYHLEQEQVLNDVNDDEHYIVVIIETYKLLTWSGYVCEQDCWIIDRNLTCLLPGLLIPDSIAEYLASTNISTDTNEAGLMPVIVEDELGNTFQLTISIVFDNDGYIAPTQVFGLQVVANPIIYPEQSTQNGSRFIIHVSLRHIVFSKTTSL